MLNFTQLSLFNFDKTSGSQINDAQGASNLAKSRVTEVDTDKINNFIKTNDLNPSFHDYVNYLLLRDEVSRSRIKGLAHSHDYFKTYPSCQNRRYMDRESQYFITARNRYKGEYPISDAVFNLIFRKFATYDAFNYCFKEYPAKKNKNYILKLKYL